MFVYESQAGRDGARWLPMQSVQSEHLAFLASDRWAEMLRRDLLPWLAGEPLGENVLEIGPGPGRTMDLLRTIAPRLTRGGTGP